MAERRGVHRGAGVAVRTTYHEEQREEAQRLAARLAGGEDIVEAPAQLLNVVEVMASHVRVEASIDSYKPAEAKSQPLRERRKRRLEAAEAEKGSTAWRRGGQAGSEKARLLVWRARTSKPQVLA